MTPARRIPFILHPRPGRRLPPKLRARRIHELAEHLRDGVRDPRLARLLSYIDDQAPIHEGNRVEVFTRGEQAFAAMLEAIAGARREVLLESYIFRDDKVGHAIFEALSQVAGRGISVRVLADAFGSMTTREAFWRDLRARGVEVRLYHPLLRQPWYHPYRDHRKILVVDRRLAFTGGMNIGEEYGSSHRTRADVWRDTHCCVEGSAAREMALVFGEGWERAGGAPFSVEAGDREVVGSARILVSESRPRRGHAEAAAVLAALVAAGRESVWITNAYFAPGAVAAHVLARAAERGVDVRLLLPSVSDSSIVLHAGHGWFSRLLERGVRIFEYRPAVLHAKAMVVDGYASVIGSSNLDLRSFQFNAECNLVILDEGTGAELVGIFEEDLSRSREVEPAAWRQRPLGHRLGDRMACLLSPLL